METKTECKRCCGGISGVIKLIIAIIVIFTLGYMARYCVSLCSKSAKNCERSYKSCDKDAYHKGSHYKGEKIHLEGSIKKACCPKHEK